MDVDCGDVGVALLEHLLLRMVADHDSHVVGIVDDFIADGPGSLVMVPPHMQLPHPVAVPLNEAPTQLKFDSLVASGIEADEMTTEGELIYIMNRKAQK